MDYVQMRTSFLADVEANPSDPAPKLAFADWLRDMENEYLAYAYEWAARRGRHPCQRQSVQPWMWFWMWGRLIKRAKKGKVQPPHMLPWMIYESMVRPDRCCRSMAACFIELATALSAVRYAVSWDGFDTANGG